MSIAKIFIIYKQVQCCRLDIKNRKECTPFKDVSFVSLIYYINLLQKQQARLSHKHIGTKKWKALIFDTFWKRFLYKEDKFLGKHLILELNGIRIFSSK